jgi:hypothetical protein
MALRPRRQGKDSFFRPLKAVFNKDPQLYDLGLNQTKLEDSLEVLQKIHQLEKVIYPL